MIEIHCDNIQKIAKNRRTLEKKLNVNITIKGKDIEIEGNSIDEYVAEKVIKALDFDFPLKIALLIKEEDFEFEILNIKNFTKRHDLKAVKARIIGQEGKTLQTLNNLTDCFFEVKNNEVGIIGDAEYLKKVQQSVISLIRGSKQANVYNFLEKHRPEPVIDLGLKIKTKTRKKKL